VDSDVGMVLQQAGSIVWAGQATAKKRSCQVGYEHFDPFHDPAMGT